NPRYATGEMLSSLRAGIDALPPDTRGFILAFADQPAVSPATLSSLLSAWNSAHNSSTATEESRSARGDLILPTFNGNRGHPVVISSALIPEIRALHEGDSLRSVVHRHLASATFVPVDDPAVLEDLDTPEDFARTVHSAAMPFTGAAHA